MGSRSLVEEAFRDPYKLDLKRVSRTILFIDIKGFTLWTEKQSPNTVSEMLEHFYRSAEEVINRHHGYPPNYLGDGILTRFENPDWAISAALDICRAMQTVLLPWKLSAGIGIAVGEVMEGLLGGKDIRQFDAIGDAVNTASRLSGVAKPGEIVISSNVLQRLQEPPKVSEPYEVTVKGKQKPLTVYSLQ
ncbi:MAG: adenylate/guanylate cyclase domain-containing protein [Chloroflexi bacterium]|nr:adenylate/guanylate cyclase domain-containing protein [Chloroflexota bacterium]